MTAPDFGRQMDPRVSALAACRSLDPELFFAERGESVVRAREVCRGCPIVVECREFAVTNNERFGIWGDTSPRDRRRIRHERRTDGAAPVRTHCDRGHVWDERCVAVARCVECRDRANRASRARAVPVSAPTLRLVAEDERRVG